MADGDFRALARSVKAKVRAELDEQPAPPSESAEYDDCDPNDWGRTESQEARIEETEGELDTVSQLESASDVDLDDVDLDAISASDLDAVSELDSDSDFDAGSDLDSVSGIDAVSELDMDSTANQVDLDSGLGEVDLDDIDLDDIDLDDEDLDDDIDLEDLEDLDEGELKDEAPPAPTSEWAWPEGLTPGTSATPPVQTTSRPALPPAFVSALHASLRELLDGFMTDERRALISGDDPQALAGLAELEAKLGTTFDQLIGRLKVVDPKS